MENKMFNGYLKEIKSEKTNKVYYAIEMYLTPNFKKMFFLKPEDLEIIKLYYHLYDKEVENIENEIDFNA